MSTQINTAYAYYQFIQTTAESILEETIERVGLDFDDVQDALYDVVSEMAGNTDVAIYYHHHLDVIKHSRYADEFTSEFGIECAGQILKDNGLDGLHASIAVYCIEQDIREWLNDNAEEVIEARAVELGEEEE